MQPLTPEQEHALMRRIVAGDQSALAEFYDQFGALVYGMTLRVLQDAALAEEAAQDTFLKIWHQAERWDAARGKVVTWLLTIARFTAIDRLLKEKRQTPPTSIDIDDMHNLGDADSIPGDMAALDADALRALLRQLPPEQVQAIELAYFQGMSHSEIAAATGQPLGTIQNRIRDGMRSLRGMWLREYE
jgi:RNA polymerase sigma-70 factor, ECF subfamily